MFYDSRARKQLGGRRRGQKSGKAPLIYVRIIVIGLMILLVLLYIYVMKVLFSGSSDSGTQSPQAAVKEQHERKAEVKDFAETHLESPAPIVKDGASSSGKRFHEFRDIAVHLAAKDPDVILSTLEEHDPFGVRAFEQALIAEEGKKGAFLTDAQLHRLFDCPHDRMTLPDQRNRERDAAFRSAPENPTYLFFQHLRKAGGTNFCSLAQNNFPKNAVADYFCMPDMEWSGNKCAGCLHSYTNEQIDDNMHKAGHRIVGNEWDPFEPARFFELGAVLATSFRKPLDRALSQFRFECIEERGCTFKKVEDWWAKRTDLTNVYVWTFTKLGLRKISIGKTAGNAMARQTAMGAAIDVVSKFHLVLVMEWLAYAAKDVKAVLGFEDTTSLTTRVRPHIAQAKRNDGQETNKMGAAGINKASWDAKEYLTPQQYKIMSENLALDEILNDIARRLFLERLLCNDV